ncbi:hypothetical protein IP88_03170 [alpha proteobacterium AAP81b]|nr:hypothetical protein IP88_03170 [alpha proteobacterium AAP81b]
MLPVALAGVLALALLGQLVLGAAEEPLPDVGGIALVARRAPPEVPPARAPASLAGRDLFTPPAVALTGGGDVAAPPPQAAIGGAAVAGSVRLRGRTMVLLALPSGRRLYLGVGGSVAGWRLAAIDPGGARFVRDGRSLTVPFGAAAPAPLPAEANPAEEQ